MASKKLTSDEVNALMEGLQSSSQTGAAVDVATSNEVRPFAFGEDDLSLMGDYYALRLINERFARLVRSIFLPMLRLQPKINPFPPEVKTYDEAQTWAKEVMAQGHEGIILKSTAGLYESKRVNHQIKIKAELEADLKVIGWVEGTGRNVDRLGALVVESADGAVKVNVGSGFTDAERDEITKDVIGSIITVKYNEIIQDKNNTTKSLFLPRFIEIRLDPQEFDDNSLLEASENELIAI